MSNKARKYVWPGALAMSIAFAGVLAAFLVLGVNPATTDAHSGPNDSTHCGGITGLGIIGHNNDPANTGSTQHTCADPSNAPPAGGSNGNGNGGMMVAAGDVSVESSSTSGSATVELKLKVKLTEDVPVGGAFVLYLEDDYQEPDSISASDVYFVSSPSDVKTGYESRVYATVNPEIDTDDHFTADKKDIDIRVSVPDMCTTDTPVCQGANGLKADDTVTMVIQKSGGIKNPSEAGTHSVGASVLGPTANVGDPMYRTDKVYAKDSEPATMAQVKNNIVTLGMRPETAHDENADVGLKTLAKITLSDVDDSRGYEMTVTGSGFNNGTTAGVYVLADASATETPSCESIIMDGTNVGDALVGSDDKVAVTFEVTAPTFKPGNVNYICMVDGEGRMSSTDVEDFELEPSIKVVPRSVSSGDTVNVFAQDYPASAGGFVELKLAGRSLYMTGGTSNTVSVNSGSIGDDGSGTATFKMPGGYEGVLRIDAKWGTVNEDSKITVAGADLSVSKTEALPNETLTVTGNGFASQSCIPAANVTLDNVAVMVDDESLGGNCGSNEIEVSNSGQFVATIILWPQGSNKGGPTLIAGTHELAVEDDDNFSASVDITIAEPTVTVTPDVAGPRDYITITGENWPVDNPEGSISPSITIEVDDNRNARTYTVFADGVGRVTQEHRVHRNVSIPSDVQVKMTYEDVSKIGSFAVPASTIEVTPSEGQPGDTITLTATNMKVYTGVDSVSIGSSTQDNPGVNTDRDGNVTVPDVLIPGLDPGVYSVVINVDGTIAIGEINVLAESSAAGAPAELPGAVDSLGDSLVAIFHFDDVGKEWSFYDPRPEFADLNTLTEMVNGEAYWILVSETVDDVVLNNKARSLTCRGADCWNLEVW